ncbi:MAG: hypothetical protein EP311_04905 [Cytophagales bacterium]|uniref:DUF3472 domain-containing protein n=1 Tax=Algoriphagus taiwanensis TaxID=1445656 RepID=A0ABQ6Q5I5_9BACT|nr:MAG: hypothetical protein EP311_04905 [Cytophagales bacterium]GMQ35435.1 hypothetical protein Ataiwa_37080 [Algoriphagus taiwanensis]
MEKTLSFFLFFFLLQLAMAQENNRVNYSQLGISFTIPNAWQGQEYGEGVLLQSQSIPGIILITTHNQKIAELKAQGSQGINDGQGTMLQLVGNLDNLGPHSIAGNYQGTLEGSPAQSYIIALENPTGGLGVTILVAAQPQQFSEALKKAGKDLADSFEFTKVDRTSELAEWKSWLSGMRLTYMESYNSPSYSDGGISGGYSLRRVIDLCPQGFFNYSGSSSFTMDGLGHSSNNQKGDGTWEILTGNNGTPILRLTYYNGEIGDYRLEFKDNKLYLNGERYFRTNDSENSPNCI